MAHVLLPCDLPTWNDIQRHLAQLKSSTDTKTLIRGMTKIYEICNISLEPEELNQTKQSEPEPIFENFEKFLEGLPEEDKKKFFDNILPNLVSQALCLRLAKPHDGFLYSLKREDCKFELDRNYIKSLLANCFFSTFTKRTSKTHPSLQNFAFCDFFQHLQRRSQQKKLKAFFRYFENAEGKKKGLVQFHRRLLNNGTSQPSLPGWLCSDRALVPLVIRHEGNIHDAEPNVWRAFPCCPLIGGDVLQAATSLESSLFFAFPELLSCLSFVEKLDDNEALVVHGLVPYGIHKKRQSPAKAVTICLMDGMIEYAPDSDKQFEDQALLRELNKALIAFDQKHNADDDTAEMIRESQRRHTPVGESSSSEYPSACSSRRASTRKEQETQNHQRKKSSNLDPVHKKLDIQEEDNCQHQESKQVFGDNKKRCCLPFLSNTSSLEEYNSSRRVVKDVDTSSRPLSEFPKIAGTVSSASQQHQTHSHSLTASNSRSSTRSMKTASESSLELPLISQILPSRIGLGEDEYYTADEDSDRDGSDYAVKVRRKSHHKSNLSSLLKSTSPLVTEIPSTKMSSLLTKPSQKLSSSKDSASGDFNLSFCESNSRKSESLGFVLGGTASDEDVDEFALEEEERTGSMQGHLHERLEDFRKRIRRRTRRHLSRKMRSSSRSSYSLGSSTSSDMEDISEEQDGYYHPGVIRASNSEPSLFTANLDKGSAILSTYGAELPPFSPRADTVVVSVGGRKVMVTSSNGQLKAYSYDGVNPNLPVPFRAKFRTRRTRPSSENDAGKSGDSHKENYWSSTPQQLNLGLSLSGSITDSDEDRSSRRRLSNFSSLSSVGSCQQENSMDNTEDAYSDLRLRIHPIAVGPSKCGDPQLRALILWLAASMARSPSLIFYTGHEPHLYELSTVHRKVLSRQWTVGDLSCEVLRFCRNRLSPKRRSTTTSLFDQLLNSGTVSMASSVSYSQQSLD